MDWTAVCTRKYRRNSVSVPGEWLLFIIRVVEVERRWKLAGQLELELDSVVTFLEAIRKFAQLCFHSYVLICLAHHLVNEFCDFSAFQFLVLATLHGMRFCWL